MARALRPDKGSLHEQMVELNAARDEGLNLRIVWEMVCTLN
jgi:hypothetical protein